MFLSTYENAVFQLVYWATCWSSTSWPKDSLWLVVLSTYHNTVFQLVYWGTCWSSTSWPKVSLWLVVLSTYENAVFQLVFWGTCLSSTSWPKVQVLGVDITHLIDPPIKTNKEIFYLFSVFFMKYWLTKWTVHCKEPITENSKQILPEKELHGHNPNFHIHVSVSDLYIPTIDLTILLQEICGPTLGLHIYKSLTDTWMRKWDWGQAVPRKRIHQWGFCCSVVIQEPYNRTKIYIIIHKFTELKGKFELQYIRCDILCVLNSTSLNFIRHIAFECDWWSILPERHEIYSWWAWLSRTSAFAFSPCLLLW